MYTVTFYSFKGGVGRSMALVNVGVQLAQSGKKVLLVDFDLEAPGLPTFTLSKPTEEVPGVVDFVSHYLTTGESPDVSNYLYISDQFPSGGGIWVMPVGRQDSQYSQRLNSIDWQDLYTNRSGYLLFEDLKEQWKSTLSPDYVLIDSRTGHSDVEGVCTRQLPDAVSLLFFPNEQNLQGLTRIVSNIHSENNKRSAEDKIRMHFAVSNVPDLDDEDHILQSTLSRFQSELRYQELAAEIHHYNSLSLLNQEIFSLRRPNSRLTKEYRVLVEAITRENLQDRDAVLRFLSTVHSNLPQAMADSGPSVLQDKYERILENFGHDGEVCFRVALLYEQLGRIEDALTLLSGNTEATFAAAPMFAARARLNHRLAHNQEAVSDLKRMMTCDAADIETILEVTPIIDRVAPELYEQLAASPAFQSLTPEARLFFVVQSEGNKTQLHSNITILTDLQRAVPPPQGLPERTIKQSLMMADIGVGDFQSAVQILQPPDGDISKLDIADSFNLAIATWGDTGVPPIETFKQVVMLDEGSVTKVRADSPNYNQCMAITHAALGNRDTAMKFLDKARSGISASRQRTFSAWTYCRVTPNEFMSHLNEMETLIVNGEMRPRIFRRPT